MFINSGVVTYLKRENAILPVQSLKEVKDCQISACGKLRGHSGTASPQDTLAVSDFKGVTSSGQEKGILQ